MARASIGKTDAALRELERSAERETQIFYMQYDPICDGIGVASGIRALERHVGLE
jgi:hypothetical protein